MLAAVGAAACGDNTLAIGPPLAPADSLFIVAHLDDDLIFMQPELATALAAGSATTVYVCSGDPVRGAEHAEHTFEAAMTAYEHATGSSDWDCGYLRVDDTPIHHCRLRDRSVSMIGLDVPDGGRHDEYSASLLHMVENRVASLPILGPIAGRVTTSSLVAELAAIITATAPRELHSLDRAATHGDDHPGHLMTASFALWAAAHAGYDGTVISHRGYNVAVEPANLSDADYAAAKPMLGYFEACYLGCAPCGTECPRLDPSHEIWLRRQYASIAAPADATLRLEAEAAPASCLALADDDSIGLTDCASAAALHLDRDRHLRAGPLCVAAGDANDEPIALAPCAGDPAQYWLLDDEGFVWSGRPPNGVGDMLFDHVRCLQAEAGGRAGAPVCGSRLRPRWRVRP